ncbi:MAG TPA: helicase-related protein [Acetobacteraceae bacterium]|nr:helicase-related protein [Acetobacteraceae bacterium]
MGSDSSRVRAVLGPTNTGKTRLAVERMLAHRSGIIGFPLRLLARENYERMVAAKGAGRVALITGEEKITPPGASWFSCTVEAMPLERKAAFVAVDEIQLAADPDRGHVFTERLMAARGTEETLFLGAETIRPLLARLVPEAEIETRPRLSTLAHAGPAKLSRLPPRSAVVAFSAAEVYAIAELIRRRRGGAAVVMGRLSPRTRNAQVALYQEKEVDFLVATDAIGMGLNMDVDHVAFAALGKFDGHRQRPLQAAELAQIAGRAGRGMRDGSFGTTAGCPPLAEETVMAMEAHRFPALTQLCWRNAALDFASIPALLASLSAPPPRPCLRRGADASDLATLAALAHETEVVQLASNRDSVRLLWEACQIPDFRKLEGDTHARLVARVFGHLARQGRLPAGWIAAEIAALARPEGDIDTLMQRLAGIRVWSFIAQRADWLEDAPHWQGQARETEDLLSEALHERLMSRFVDRRSALLLRRLEQGRAASLLAAVTRRGEVIVEGHTVGVVGGFSFRPDPEATGADRRLVLRAARRALYAEMPRRVAALEAARDTEFALAGPSLLWQGVPVARLRKGASALRPLVHVLASEFLDGPARERVRIRLQNFLDARIRSDLAPLFAAVAAAERDTALRGPMHRLSEGLGVVPGPAREDFAPALRVRLRALGVRAGRFGLFMPALLKPAALRLRALLWALAEGWGEIRALPAPGSIVWRGCPAEDGRFAAAMGWLPTGPVGIRLDVAERVAAELAAAARRQPASLPAALASRLGVKSAELPAVLRGLGFRLLPQAGEAVGEAAPLVAPLRRRPMAPGAEPGAAASPSGPFASLAVLHRR